MSRQRRVWIAIACGLLAAFCVVFLTRWHSASRSTTVLAGGFWADTSGRETYYVADQSGYAFTLPGGFTRTVWVETAWRDEARGAANTTVSRPLAEDFVGIWSSTGEAMNPGVRLPSTPGEELRWRAALAVGMIAVVVITLAGAILCVYNLVRARSGVPGRCASCGYDLTGLWSRPCPECGARAGSRP